MLCPPGWEAGWEATWRRCRIVPSTHRLHPFRCPCAFHHQAHAAVTYHEEKAADDASEAVVLRRQLLGAQAVVDKAKRAELELRDQSEVLVSMRNEGVIERILLSTEIEQAEGLLRVTTGMASDRGRRSPRATPIASPTSRSSRLRS